MTELPPRDIEELHRLFRRIVTDQALREGRESSFWYTWLASRDRFNARLWDRLVTLFRTRRALQSGGVLPTIQDQKLYPFVVALCRMHGRARPSRVTKTARPRFNFLRVLRRGALYLWWRVLAVYWPAQVGEINPDVVLVSILSREPIERSGPYRDTYFGDLHERLNDDGKEAAYCGFVTDDYRAVMRAAAQRRRKDAGLSLWTAADFYRGRDVFRAIAKALSFRAIVSPIFWEGLDLSPLVRDDLENDRGTVVQGVVLEGAWRRLMRLYPQARFIQMWENNPWEKALYRAAVVTGARCDGYFHTVAIASHIKYYMAPEEHGLRPMPRALICAGRGSAEKLRGLGHYPPGLVQAGCMLRNTLPLDRPVRRSPPQRVRRVLVVLEGLPSMVDLLRFADMAARALPDVRFAVRAHPALGLDVLAPAAGVALGGNHPLTVQVGGDFSDALKEADVVLYQGSMASITALFLGIPVIKFRMDELVDDDPLGGCEHLHWQIADLKGLCACFEAIQDMGEAQFRTLYAAARAYILDLMAIESSETLQPFLNPPSALPAMAASPP